MFYKKCLIIRLICKDNVFINRCERKIEKFFLNLLNFNNVFSCHNNFFFIISCMYLNYSYFCRLKKSVPYVVPVKGYLLDTVDFYKKQGQFRTCSLICQRLVRLTFFHIMSILFTQY